MQIGVEISRALDNRRIFVVHEDEIVRAALQFMLHDENEAHEVASVEEAFRKAANAPPDLVLLDMALVWKKGIALLEEFGRKLSKTRVLLVAESDDDPDAHACLSLGAHGVMGKPFTVSGVRMKVDAALGRAPSYAAWRASF
ncbi:MAG: response regulator [Fibrobacterota bacterium]